MTKNNETIDYIIEILTKLMIKVDFEEKSTNKEIYVRKKTCYKDLIDLLKNQDLFIE